MRPPHKPLNEQFTMEEFLALAPAAYGRSNPELSDNKFWLAVAEQGWGASAIRDEFGLYRKGGPPIWTSVRQYGTRTFVPASYENDYRPDSIVTIGGWIGDLQDKRTYNDIIDLAIDGTCNIYTYPVECFPPTTGHSATYVGPAGGLGSSSRHGQILIVGGSGGPTDFDPSVAPVYRLDLTNFQIHVLETKGSSPSQISNHQAILWESELIVFSQRRLPNKDQKAQIHFLHLPTLTWREGEVPPLKKP